jgi:hypothetical protein
MQINGLFEQLPIEQFARLMSRRGTAPSYILLDGMSPTSFVLQFYNPKPIVAVVGTR